MWHLGTVAVHVFTIKNTIEFSILGFESAIAKGNLEIQVFKPSSTSKRQNVNQKATVKGFQANFNELRIKAKNEVIDGLPVVKKKVRVIKCLDILFN